MPSIIEALPYPQCRKSLAISRDKLQPARLRACDEIAASAFTPGKDTAILPVMDATPELDPHTQELRMLMRTQWGDSPFQAADFDRILRLFGLVDGPYHRKAFGKMTAVERLVIIANHQMEACEWKDAYRTVNAIDRIERRLAKEDQATAEPNAITGQPRPPTSRPAPAPPEPEPPEPTPRERYRELADARRDMVRAKAGKPPFPRAQPSLVPPAPQRADRPAVSLPFT